MKDKKNKEKIVYIMSDANVDELSDKKIVIEDGAMVDYIFLINCQNEPDLDVRIEVVVKDGALANFYYCALGSGSVSVRVEYIIYSKSRINQRLVCLSRGSGKAEVFENFKFLGSGSTGVFLCDGVAMDNSSLEIVNSIETSVGSKGNTGLIDMKAHLLGKKARGVLVPTLKMLSHDASMCHKAKVYNFTQPSIDYLNTRLIDKRGREGLLKGGLFKTFANEVGDDQVKEIILKNI